MLALKILKGLKHLENFQFLQVQPFGQEAKLFTSIAIFFLKKNC